MCTSRTLLWGRVPPLFFVAGTSTGCADINLFFPFFSLLPPNPWDKIETKYSSARRFPCSFFGHCCFSGWKVGCMSPNCTADQRIAAFFFSFWCYLGINRAEEDSLVFSASSPIPFFSRSLRTRVRQDRNLTSSRLPPFPLFFFFSLLSTILRSVERAKRASLSSSPSFFLSARSRRPFFNFRTV